jgi:hypothetical protein
LAQVDLAILVLVPTAAILYFLLLPLQAAVQDLAPVVEYLMATQADLAVVLALVGQVALQVQQDKVMQVAQLTLHHSLVVAVVVVQALLAVVVTLQSAESAEQDLLHQLLELQSHTLAVAVVVSKKQAAHPVLVAQAAAVQVKKMQLMEVREQMDLAVVVAVLVETQVQQHQAAAMEEAA